MFERGTTTNMVSYKIPFQKPWWSLLSNPNYDFRFQFLIPLSSHISSQSLIKTLRCYGYIEKLYFAKVNLLLKNLY